MEGFTSYATDLKLTSFSSILYNENDVISHASPQFESYQEVGVFNSLKYIVSFFVPTPIGRNLNHSI